MPSSPSTRAIRCSKCGMELPIDFSNSDQFHACPACGTPTRIELFPAFYAPPPVPIVTAGLGVMEGEAACFYHAEKKAVLHCDRCGRFLCALCDLTLGIEHICPTCLQSSRAKRDRSLENFRVLYDNIAFLLATLPLLLWPFTIVTSPAAIFLVIYGWKKPMGIIPRRRIKRIVALILASAQVIGWAIGIYVIFRKITRG